jgi:hypothetical protein
VLKYSSKSIYNGLKVVSLSGDKDAYRGGGIRCECARKCNENRIKGERYNHFFQRYIFGADLHISRLRVDGRSAEAGH